MTNQEMVAALKGGQGQKQMLYEYFMTKIQNGESLDDNELPIFEAVRKEMTKPTNVVQMSGHAVGVGRTLG